MKPVFRTQLGRLYEADCMKVLPSLKSASIDTIFADPPFNLKKDYGGRADDDRSEEKYMTWCREWLRECERLLKPGGSFFVYNLPKWNIHIAPFLCELGLEFRHWIAIEHKSSLPIQGRLYPAHYSLLYFSKGKPSRFSRIRTPIETCRHCGGEIRDYGGHRHAMNPNGVNLKDIWTDIPPVRHRKFKSDKRAANALSTKLLERVIEISTHPGDLVLDPFGGSGTTFAVCEQRHRHWIGTEIESTQAIVERLTGDIDHHKNNDFIESDYEKIPRLAAE
ncbi:site-specific DNA-methyltransferase [Mesorhizobium sp.]|uniref:DNA-methyltransferase n=1 Tax=Mesorhizobium sp. TaxID=1871066 RepID=UPI000FE93041|nr:site-specific DNA-methyltransferase [Mesorhizobium sp.]RWA81303.1 MAG: site-specific DNA-methyltransferase [Mesorhizobium sp.]